MIENTYREIRNGFELKAEGHCRYAEKGKDIACAGVSTLIVALANTLEGNENKIKIQARIYIEAGYALICAYPKKRYYKEIASAFETVKQGVSWLSEEFEKNVKKGFYVCDIEITPLGLMRIKTRGLNPQITDSLT